MRQPLPKQLSQSGKECSGLQTSFAALGQTYNQRSPESPDLHQHNLNTLPHPNPLPLGEGEFLPVLLPTARLRIASETEKKHRESEGFSLSQREARTIELMPALRGGVGVREKTPFIHKNFRLFTRLPHCIGNQDRSIALSARGKRAFTLAEMLVVIAIIAIISTIAIPAMKGLTESNTMTSATRQLLDDMAFARQKAISGRTKVYMVFISPEFWLYQDFNLLGAESQKQADTLIKGQYTSYALFSERSLGEQPGKSFPRYLTPWRTLPEGAMIGAKKFQPFVDFATSVEEITDPPQYATGREYRIYPFSFRRFPFPPAELTNSSPVRVILPYIAFDSTGGILDDRNESAPPMFQNNNSVAEPHEIIPLARGSIFYPLDAAGKPLRQAPDVTQRDYKDNYNLIRIDKLTGRAKLERMELP